MSVRSRFFMMSALVPILIASTSAQAQGGWSYFGGSHKFQRYSPDDQITRENVKGLQVLWTRPGIDPSLTKAFPDIAPSNYLRGTPTMIDGVLYAPNAIGLIEAFDPATGATIWVQQPFANTLKEAAGQSTRGIDSWRGKQGLNLYAVRGEYLYSIDAKTGLVNSTFGTGGRVSLRRDTPDNAPFFGFNAPIVVGSTIVIGGQGGGAAGGGYGDGGPTKEARPEAIRGYDVESGKLLWSFELIPPMGDKRRETWGGDSANFVGNMGAWAPLAADDELNMVYVPLTAPTNSYFGGHRPGDNLYGNSLVALDAKTGKLVWYYQMVHHDVWDADNASPPTIADLKVGRKLVKAVIVPNKNGFLFVFDRKTGKPVWPIVERSVPASDVPGEHLSPTQPFPSKPEPFDRQGLSEADLIDFTPELHAEAKQILARYRYGPLFTPPAIAGQAGKLGTLSVPGAWGTGNWNMGAFDPVEGRYYAVSMTLPGLLALSKPTGPDGTIDYEFARPARPANTPRVSEPYGPGPQGLPLLKPPYNRITAYDMNKGEKLWQVAAGDGPRNHPLLKNLNLPPLGTPGRPVPLLTKGLLFLGESSDALFGSAGVKGPSVFRAYDKTSGEIVWETQLPAGTTGGPVSYVANGKQFIVVPVGGKDAGTSWIALGLK